MARPLGKRTNGGVNLQRNSIQSAARHALWSFVVGTRRRYGFVCHLLLEGTEGKCCAQLSLTVMTDMAGRFRRDGHTTVGVLKQPGLGDIFGTYVSMVPWIGRVGVVELLCVAELFEFSECLSF